MNTNAPTPNDRDADFELPPLPRYVDNEFVAKWEAEGRQTSCRMLKLGAELGARLTRIDLEFDHWVVTDRQWAESVSRLHALCQELQVASPLDGKVRLHTETAVRWVEGNAYEQNPHQWDNDGKVWVRTAVAL